MNKYLLIISHCCCSELPHCPEAKCHLLLTSHELEQQQPQLRGQPNRAELPPKRAASAANQRQSNGSAENGEKILSIKFSNKKNV
jgi:hypothetical protein